jgi:hypothetical protein
MLLVLERDRKGLVGNLIFPLANLLFFGWLGSGALTHGQTMGHTPGNLPAWLADFCLISLAISALQTGIRVHLSARIYSPLFAAAAPLRMFWGNWRKTEHVYPGISITPPLRPRLGEILIRSRFVSAADLEEALILKAKGQRIGEYLVQTGKITMDDLDRALESQAGYAAVAGD